MLTEEYLIEGLKIFKKSKKLYNFANKIDKKLIKLVDKNKGEEIKVAQKLSKDVKKLADEFKVIEDAFADKELDKKSAKSKLKTLQMHHQILLKHVSSKQTKSLLGKIGLGVLAVGLVAVLGNVAIPSGLIQSVGANVGKTAMNGTSVLSNSLSAVGNVGKSISGAAANAIKSVKNK